MNTPAQLAKALGVSLYTTDLYIPDYKDGAIGRWRITHGQFGLDRGYFSGLWAVNGMPVLLRSKEGQAPPQWDTWMSLSPHEIESQELGCRHAFGRAVVMGLGMGWVAINMALNPAVKQVAVIERDPAVIDLFRHSGATDKLPGDVLGKLEIIQADALEWRPQGTVDFLYADIWLNLAEPRALDETRRMQRNVCASSLYYWGQELGIYAYWKRLPEAGAFMSGPQIQQCIGEYIALPLLVPPGLDYAALITRVVQNRQARNLPIISL